jgi:hypothetical protein
MTLLKILNPYGFYDSSPLLIQEFPDIEKIFNNPEPAVIQMLSKDNRAFWKTASISERKMTLFIGYLQHPNSEVKIKTIALLRNNSVMRVSQVLLDVLASDPYKEVRIAAANMIWKKEGDCSYSVDMLKDEIKYGSERSIVGPSRARKAIQLLLDNAPNQKARKTFNSLVQ